MHSRHRSPTNAFVNIISGLIAYFFKPRKPAIKLNKLEASVELRLRRIEVNQELETKNDICHNLELSGENNITQFEHVLDHSTCCVDNSLTLDSKHDVVDIKPFSKLAYVEGFEGDASLRTKACSNICEDLRTGITYKSPAEVSFKKGLLIMIIN